MNKLTLHARQKKLLSILNAKHGVETGKELSAKLGISERTVRNDISEINDQLRDFGIQILPLYGKGYTLSIRDRSAFVELFQEKDSYITKDDRVRTLLIRLLREDDWYDLGELEDEMFVSRTTLENDLRAIKHRISARHPYLQMERKGNYIKLENNEIKRRDMMIRLYAENWDYDSRQGVVLKQDEFGPEVLKTIQSELKKSLNSRDIRLDDFAYIYLTLSVAVMYFRAKDGHVIRHLEGNRTEDEVHAVVRDVLSVLEEEWNIEFTTAGCIWLSDILRQLSFLSDQSYSKNKVLENTDVKCHHIVDELLYHIEEVYGIDFTYDDKFFVDITRHVQALFDGIIAPQFQNNVMGDELRRKYPFLGDIAHFMRCELERQCEIELGKDEENYLLPFLISAEHSLYLEKRGEGIPTVVISHLNTALTHHMMEELDKHYRNELSFLGPVAVFAKERVREMEPMLVLTTVQMSRIGGLLENIPMLTISGLVEREDRLQIEKYLTSLRSTLLYKAPEQKLGYYFDQKLIYRMKGKESLTTVFKSVQENMVKNGALSRIQPVDLEQQYFTVQKNGFLFLYQEDENVEEMVGSMVRLAKPISWKHVRNIQTVMYMVIPPNQKKTLGWFYYLASALAKRPEELEAVMNGTSLEEIGSNISPE